MLRSLPGWLLENFWLLKNSYLSSLETVLFFSDWIKLFKNCLIFIYLCLSLFVRIEVFNYPLLYCHGGKSWGLYLNKETIPDPRGSCDLPEWLSQHFVFLHIHTCILFLIWNMGSHQLYECTQDLYQLMVDQIPIMR